jgi:hypothetical protein
VVRPSLVMVLLSVLAIVALMVSIHSEFPVGSTYRALRLIGFTVVLWLLTPWWGRADFPLLRAHLVCLRVIIVSVIVGAIVAPGAAFAYGGRLSGALWPIPPTQVGHYAAVLLGGTVLLWFGGAVRGRTAMWTLLPAGAVLIGAHTRTALIGMTIGLAVAGELVATRPDKVLLFVPDLLNEVRQALPEIELNGGRWVVLDPTPREIDPVVGAYRVKAAPSTPS